MTDFRPRGFQQIPVVVRNLLIINVLVFLVKMMFESRGLSFGRDNTGNLVSFEDLFALHSWQSTKFRWWQMFTHMFMHGGFGHIFFNMFALWMFGRILENVWGAQRFIIFYLICGVGAAICHEAVLSFEHIQFYDAFKAYQQHPSFEAYAQFMKQHPMAGNSIADRILNFWSLNKDCGDCASTSITNINAYYAAVADTATVGASGAVFGLLFAFGYLFPNTELYIYFIPVPVKAKWVVTGYALIEITQGLANSAGDNIAHFAHLGGMLFAFILLRIWKKNVRNDFY